jgi:monoamine oxidase
LRHEGELLGMDTDAIVIGAGAAGLAAARSLAGRSLRVIVLEARDRIGGRVLTGPSAPSGVPAELGAEFIHGPAPETRAILREAGSADVETGGDSWACNADGDLMPADDFSSAAGIFEGVRKLPADESVERFLERFAGNAATQATVKAARLFVEGFDAADPAIASARGIADEWSSGVDFTSARPLGGYRPMFDRLLADCDALGVERRLSTVVHRISWKRGNVGVETLDAAAKAQSYNARAVIITLPIGVLRAGDESAVAFHPGLPLAKREAIDAIEMGHAVKVTLRFRSAFWEQLRGGRYREAGFFRGAGQPFMAYWTQMPVHVPLITAWAGGPRAIALSEISRADLIERALEGFGAVFKEASLAHEEFESGSVHDWSRDPFARGAYSYLAVNGGDARLRLAAPVDDTLFFAGEATANNGQGGTVNGALETGERAAREAAAVLGGTT